MIVNIKEKLKRGKEVLRDNTRLSSNNAKIPQAAHKIFKVELTKVHFLETTKTFFPLCSSPLKAKGLKHGSIARAGQRVTRLIVDFSPKWYNNSDNCCKRQH